MAAPVMLQQTTSYKVVLPFYIYGAVSFLIGCILLFSHSDLFESHYFMPFTLAITHTMALGWGTMIILGASHQLLPVLVEGKLDSNLLAYFSFFFSAIGIPLLVWGFYTYNAPLLLQSGAILVNIAVICYVLNVFRSIFNSVKANINAWFIATAAIWLLSTTLFGLLLVLNLHYGFLPGSFLNYLSVHAHMGMVGWFLMLVMGVGSRLIPMFLISKYADDRTLWVIYILTNLSLISFILIRITGLPATVNYLSLALVLTAVYLLANFCRKAYLVRIRKSVDQQMKMSLLSIIQMVLPILVLLVITVLSPISEATQLPILYGFSIFFGWITAIILGMTFKTLPFIVWNKVYHKKAHKGKTPAPKELFSEKNFEWMTWFYLGGFILFIIGIILTQDIIVKSAAGLLVIAAVFYVINVGKTLLHKPKVS